jgi:aminobenzoyl-glutamate utilization protein B
MKLSFAGTPPSFGLALLALLVALPLEGQDAKDRVAGFIDQQADHFATTAQTIWDLAEVGYQEERSSALLQEEARNAGFTVESGVAGMPTAFIASWGSGKPVVAILAEFDALPGINQDRVPERTTVEGKRPSGNDSSLRHTRGGGRSWQGLHGQGWAVR